MVKVYQVHFEQPWIYVRPLEGSEISEQEAVETMIQYASWYIRKNYTSYELEDVGEVVKEAG